MSHEQTIDILWGWKAIAAALGVSVETAQRLEKNEGLPVRRRHGKTVQSTRRELQEWAEE